MKFLIYNIIISLLLSSSLFAQSVIDYKGLPEWAWHKINNTEFFVYTPRNMDTGKKYPIALYMHGCCGQTDNATYRNLIDPQVRMWHNFGENTQTEPTFIVVPGITSNWTPHFANLKAAIDSIITNHNGDPKRVYVTGFSMGGGGTWNIINTYPNFFAAALPVGMNYGGAQNLVKNIPIWTTRGSADSNASNLHLTVAQIRALNGDSRGAIETETGVNPLFTSYPGEGHGPAQWLTAKREEVLEWMYSKINDGNIYPNAYFVIPTDGSIFKQSKIPVEIFANDNDGTISKVEIYVNKKLQKTLNVKPFKDSVIIRKGENLIEAIAFDNLNKTTKTSIKVYGPTSLRLNTLLLPKARMGVDYSKQLFAYGNGKVTYKLADNSILPQGLSLSSNGLLAGMPMESGVFSFKIQFSDNVGNSLDKIYSLEILPAHEHEVLVTNIQTAAGVVKLDKLKNGITPNSTLSDEITFSNCDSYDGLTCLILNPDVANSTANEYLRFDINQDATVYVAYEKKDRLYTSTIPAWLSEFTRVEHSEIVAQYFYYNVYKKDFKAGTVSLPGARASENNVSSNYVVMVKKQNFDGINKIEISTDTLPIGFLHYEYNEQLCTLGGNGKVNWKIKSGNLPQGLKLKPNGLLTGFPTQKGEFTFTIGAKDALNDTVFKSFKLIVDSAFMNPVSLNVKDTLILVNSGPHVLNFTNVSNGFTKNQKFSLQASASDPNVLKVNEPVQVNDTTFSLSFKPITDRDSEAYITLILRDSLNPDTLYNTTNSRFKVKILRFVNNPPSCTVTDKIVVDKESARKNFYITDITDGNDGSQAISITAYSSNPQVTWSLIVTYTKGANSGYFSFTPSTQGTATITLTLTDNGNTLLGGSNERIIEIPVTVNAPTDIHNLSASNNNILIYPNPANDVVFLQNDFGFSSYEITSLSGVLLQKGSMISGHNSINVSGVKSGFYLIKLMGEKDISLKLKIINK